jgi:hypothetical protein
MTIVADIAGTTEPSFKIKGFDAITTDAIFKNIEGLELSVNGGNAQYIDIAAGKATIDGASARWITNSAAFTKRLIGAWVIGNNQNGLLIGTTFPASTTVHAYIMRRRSDGVIDHGFHTSATQTTFTDGSSNIWDLRLHMSFLTGAASVGAFFQTGNEVTYASSLTDQTVNIPTTATLYTLSIPQGINNLKAVISVTWGVLTGGTPPNAIQFWLSDPKTTDQAPSTGLNNGVSTIYGTTPVAGYTSAIPMIITTDTSARIRARASQVSNGTTLIVTRGFIHPRGMY